MTRQEMITRLKAIQTEMRSEGADIEALMSEATELRAKLDQLEARNKLFGGLPDDNTPDTNPIQNRIIELLEQRTALYPLITRSNVPGALKVPVESAGSAAAWKTENDAIAGTEAPITSISFAGYELVKLVTVSIAAKLMTIDAFETFIVNQIVRKMSIAIEAAIVSGSGVGEPTGILTGVTFAIDGAAPNKVEFTKDGVPTYDNIMDALALLPGDYHANAVFVCSNKTKYKYIRKIKDNDGRPFFDQGMIDGKKVIVNDRVPDKKVLICDPSYYQMNAQKEISIDISDQSGFRNAQIDYRGYAVMDGKPLLKEAFVLIDEAVA